MKVALLGYGVEGEASYRYFLEKGADITIVDEAESPKAELPPGVPTILGADALSSLKDFDVVVRTPPVNPKKIITDGVVTSATKEFFNVCPSPIIGVTGTKGKGTTCSLIQAILISAGIKAHLVGNIGTPALDKLGDISPDDVVVYEMSSFQLWDMDVSPHIAVALMIEPDHLNIHDSMDDYVNAKGNICRWQSTDDYVIFTPHNEWSSQIASTSQASKIKYMSADGVDARDGYFWFGDQIICPTSAVTIPGQHNIENACAAIAAAWQFVRDPTQIANGLSSFTGLPHHIEEVRTVRGVTYYDDSFSSAPTAAAVAIKAIDAPTVLILGGFDKGADFTELAKLILERKSIRKVILIGQIRERIANALISVGFKNFEIIDTTDFEQIVRYSATHAQPGDAVLLSPGCASFDMFKDFYERGDRFKQIVGAL